MKHKPTPEDIAEFKAYVTSFYGPNGIYEDYFKPLGATEQEIDEAIAKYIASLNNDITWGGGDSTDRERVRDLMLQARGQEAPLYKTGGNVSKQNHFELGTPAVHHFLGYNGNPEEEAGEIVMNDIAIWHPKTGPDKELYVAGTLKGIKLYPNKNYSGTERIFIVPNWNNVETFAEANKRQHAGKKFEIKSEKFEQGGNIPDVVASGTMQTPDGEITGKVRYNEFYKKYQVYIDDALYGEHNTPEDAIDELDSAGIKNIQKFDKGGKVNGHNLVISLWNENNYSYPHVESNGKVSLGTIRTGPQGYYVATIYHDGTVNNSGIEANTKDIPTSKIQSWYNEHRWTNNPRLSNDYLIEKIYLLDQSIAKQGVGSAIYNERKNASDVLKKYIASDPSFKDGGSVNASQNTKQKMQGKDQQQRIDALIEEVEKHNWSKGTLTVNSGIVKVYAGMYDLEPIRVAAIFNKYQKPYGVKYDNGGRIKKPITLIISNKAPLSSQLEALTGKSFNSTDFETPGQPSHLSSANFTEIETGQNFIAVNGKEAVDKNISGIQIPSQSAIYEFFESIAENGEHNTIQYYLNNNLLTEATITSLLSGYGTGATPQTKHALMVKLAKFQLNKKEDGGDINNQTSNIKHQTPHGFLIYVTPQNAPAYVDENVGVINFRQYANEVAAKMRAMGNLISGAEVITLSDPRAAEYVRKHNLGVPSPVNLLELVAKHYPKTVKDYGVTEVFVHDNEVHITSNFDVPFDTAQEIEHWVLTNHAPEINTEDTEEFAGGGKVKKLAKLTPEENREWEKTFEYYLNDGLSESKADKLTWQDLQQQFPRLKEFTGAQPGVYATGGSVNDLEQRIKTEIQNHEADVTYDEYGDAENAIFKELENYYGWNMYEHQGAADYMLKATAPERLQYLLDNVLPTLKKEDGGYAELKADGGEVNELTPTEQSAFDAVYKKFADKDYFELKEDIERKEKERLHYASQGNETALKTTKADIEAMFNQLNYNRALGQYKKLKKLVETADPELKKYLRANQKFTIAEVEVLTGKSLKGLTNQKALDEFVDSLPVKKSLGGFAAGVVVGAAGLYAAQKTFNKPAPQQTPNTQTSNTKTSNWKDEVKAAIDKEGFDSAFTSYSNWDEIKNPKFQTLKKQYATANKAIATYINQSELFDTDAELPVKEAIEKEGLDYGIVGYHNWEGVKDKKFHALRAKYISTRKVLAKYLGVKHYESGGHIGFEKLEKKVAKQYVGKPVPKKYQAEYGKTYSKEEAKVVGIKVANKVKNQTAIGRINTELKKTSEKKPLNRIKKSLKTQKEKEQNLTVKVKNHKQKSKLASKLATKKK